MPIQITNPVLIALRAALLNDEIDIEQLFAFTCAVALRDACDNMGVPLHADEWMESTLRNNVVAPMCNGLLQDFDAVTDVLRLAVAL